MNRHSDGKTIRERISKIRELIPDAAIRTTVMTGFPTETDGEFEELLSFVKETGFDRLGAFAFSSEEGTGAYRMRGQVPEKTRRARRDRILKTQNGRTYKDSVEVDGMVMFESGKKPEPGDFVRVKITDGEGYDLTGREI